MEIKIICWLGSSANDGLNLGAGMPQQFMVTSDGPLEKTMAFRAHAAAGKNRLGNSVELICWPSLWFENGVFFADR